MRLRAAAVEFLRREPDRGPTNARRAWMLDPATTWFLREYSRLCQRHGRRLHHPTAQCVAVVDEDAKSIQAHVARLFAATEMMAEAAVDSAKEGGVPDGDAEA